MEGEERVAVWMDVGMDVGVDVRRMGACKGEREGEIESVFQRYQVFLPATYIMIFVLATSRKME